MSCKLSMPVCNYLFCIHWHILTGFLLFLLVQVLNFVCVYESNFVCVFMT